MTAKQRAARAKFKAVVAEAKKLRKKNPKLTQAQAVKQAFAISYSKKRAGVGAVKKKAAPTKVKAKKSKPTSDMHKDTKSHNVNIRVISGFKKIGNLEEINKGDILVCSWGYDQTNVDFYYVVKKTGLGVSIIPMSSKIKDYDHDRGTVIPGEPNYGQKPMNRKIKKYSGGLYVKINSFSTARKWDGRPQYFSTYA